MGFAKAQPILRLLVGARPAGFIPVYSSSGSFSAALPPSEKAGACHDQARQAGARDGAGDWGWGCIQYIVAWILSYFVRVTRIAAKGIASLKHVAI